MSNTVRTSLFVFCLLLIAGCSDCEACKEAPEPAPPPVPDVSVEDEPEDPLKEAREKAVDEAESLAVHLGDISRAVAAEVEAQARKSPAPPRPRLAKKKKGTIDVKAVNAVFAANETSMRKCYERVLKKNPILQGRVRLAVVLGEDGNVKSVSANGSSLQNPVVHECMEREARSMSFPKPQGGAVTVNKTFFFAPDF